MVAQYLGAFLAAVAIWGEYADAIKMVSPFTSDKNVIPLINRLS